ncbi:MAG: hypothetical protein ABJJ69_21150, partial [Paracoccaceae bacterium]
MNRFPVLKRLIVSNYLLYPGTAQSPGIDFSFEGGLSILAGINGLGKTTLINMLFRVLVGPFELPKDSGSAKFGAAAKANVTLWTKRKTYFSQRVPDRAKEAWAELHFNIGETTFVVRRSLANLQLLHCAVSGDDIAITPKEELYQAELCKSASAGQFVDFLTAVKYLSFFNEERRDILWDDQAQRQFFRILFTTPEEAREWIEAEQNISSADSRARNISATAYQYEQDLKKGRELLLSNAGTEAELASQQAILDADLARRKELEELAAKQESELGLLRRDLERTKLTEDDARRKVEEIRFRRLERHFPSLSDTANYILTQLFTDGHCLACSQNAQKAQNRLQESLENHTCVVCGSDIVSEVTTDQDGNEEDLDAALAGLKAATTQSQTLRDKEQKQDENWRRALREIRDVTAAANERSQSVASLRSQLPPPPEELAELEKNIKDLRDREKVEKERRLGAEAVYDALLDKVSGRIKAATEDVGRI